MNVPWENAHGGALYCLIRGDEFSAWHRLLFQRPGCAESVLACRHFLDGSPVARCSYPEEYHPCVISRIALLCDSVGWHKARMRDEVRAFRLRELRAAQSLTQVQVAALAHIRQSRVSSIENGDIGSAQVNTLRKYVSALGGELDITVRLGDETFTLA